MAKRRSLASSSHHFFMIVVLSVSALGLMLFTYASQQKTQTKSNAAQIVNPEKRDPNCTKPPYWHVAGTSDDSSSVTYHLKLTDNCPGENNIYEIGITEFPAKIYGYSNRDVWSWKFANGSEYEFIKKNIGDDKIARADLKITRVLKNKSLLKRKNVFTLTAKGVNNKAQGTYNLEYFVNP